MSANLDTKTEACDDFYQHACGGWMAANPLKPDEGQKTRSFSMIGDSNQATLKEISEQNWPVIGPLYQSCMDRDQIEKVGVAPVLAILPNVFSAPASSAAVVKAAGSLVPTGVQPFFALGNAVDPNAPTDMLLDIGQGGLGLPAAEYYEDANTTAAYRKHVVNMVMLWTGNNTQISTAVADAVLTFEQAVAKFTKPAAEMRDPHKLNNVVRYDKLKAAGTFDWDSFMDGAGVVNNRTALKFNMDNPDFVASVGQLVAATPAAQLMYYVFWQGLHGLSAFLPQAFRAETFAFYGGYLNGIDASAERWKTCVAQVDASLGDIIGRYYVAQKFAGDSSAKALAMVHDIEAAFGANLPDVQWMDADTRAKAQTKLSEITVQVGYPQVWSVYAGLNIVPDQFAQNVLAASARRWTRSVERLFQPADPHLWQMTPPTVNAYYDPTYNSINIPAGIVQEPMFSASYPDAANYGGIGMVEGHELTHGFDDQGAQYDGHGKLVNWWTPASAAAFKTRTDCLVNQYEQFKVNGEAVNGTLTLGENIADNGGIKLAYLAWQNQVKRNGTQPQVDKAVTNEQLFFYSFAQGWCTNMRPGVAKARLLSDPHSPAFARVNGPLANFDMFAKAFQCKSGSKMAPANSCGLW